MSKRAGGFNFFCIAALFCLCFGHGMKSLRSKLFAFGLSFGSAWPVGAVLADGAEKADLMSASQVAAICAELMPNNPEVEKTLLQSGFATAKWNGRFHMLENDQGRVAAVISGLDTYDKHCAILVRAMTKAQAEMLVSDWIAVTRAVAVQKPESKALESWDGSLDGFKASISVFESANHDVISGAWVRLVLTDKPID